MTRSSFNARRFAKVRRAAPTAGLSLVPPHKTLEMEEAYCRWMAFAGHLEDDDNEVIAGQIHFDRKHFAHLQAPDDADLSVGFLSTVEFMHAVSGLRKDWCVAWLYREFVDAVAAGTMPGDQITVVYEAALTITRSSRCRRGKRTASLVRIGVSQ
jgi:hypothetical protein